jgi:hypothetical protein
VRDRTGNAKKLAWFADFNQPVNSSVKTSIQIQVPATLLPLCISSIFTY